MGINQKIKVCHLISGDLWAGAEVQAYILLSSLYHLDELDITVIILNDGRLAEELRKTGLDVVVIEESEHSFFAILRLIKEKLKGEDIDILHTHRLKENVLGGLLKQSGMVKYLVQTVHGLSEPSKGIKALKARPYSLLSLYFRRRYFDKILPVSYDIQNEFSHRINPARLVTIHNSINIDRLKITRSSNEIRQELNLEEHTLVIGSAGRMVPVKGYDNFLKAAQIILGKKPDVRFVLAGDGPLLEELKRTAEEIGVKDHVAFLGFRNDILDIINCLDIVLLSSYHEGIPTVVLEAMALKKAVVAPKVGGIPEIIEDNVSGFLVKPGDVQGLADACLNILDEPAVRKKLGSEAEKRVKREFTNELQRDRVLKLYHELTGRAGAVQ